MTYKLYDVKPYDTKFDAIVVKVIKEGNKTVIVLDKTLFFPEEGGQSPDKGVIIFEDRSINIVDVQIKDDVIYHYAESDASFLVEQSPVSGEIDFSHRFSNMQQHTGEHIFSGLAKKHFGCTNVGFHLSDNEVTFDYDKPLTSEEIQFLETEVNNVIYENRKVTAYYPDKEELLNLDYRSKKEIEGDVRLVEIEGIDLCACCAPHVRSTGEIGICKVVNYINYKGGVRISILCGRRALELFRKLDNTTKDISKSLSARREDLAEEVNRLSDSLHNAEYKLMDMEKQYLDLTFENIVALKEGKHSLSKHIITDDCIILKLDGFNNNSLRGIVNNLKEKYPDLLVGAIQRVEKGYFFIIGSGKIDCKKVSTYLRDNYGAKGGGSSLMIQGNLDTDLSIEDVTKIYEDML